MNIEKTLYLYLKEHFLNSQDTLAIGYSGGIDSTCLLYLMHKLQKEFKYRLVAINFLHTDNPIAEDSTLLLQKKLCKQLGVNLINVSLSVPTHNGKGWESACRKARQTYYSNNHFSHVFLGHHLDDQNENTFIQLFRGAGLGVGGMKPKTTINGVQYHRPFLNIPKKELFNILQQNHLPFEDDSSSNNNHFSRNFLRNKLFPVLSEHYPNYSSRLKQIRERFKEQDSLNYDLAIVDGLQKLLDKESVDISHLNTIRAKNLIKQYLYANNLYYEDKKVLNTLETYTSNGVLSPFLSGNTSAITIKKSF